MNHKRVFQAVLVSALVLGGPVLVDASEEEASHACYSLGGGKTNCYVYQTAWTTKNPNGSTEDGILNAGWNYFYCQQAFPGRDISWHGHKNYWYLKTDDDSHNRNVWFNAVFVSSGVDSSPIPGVPHC